jgi:hypothetical protein
VLAIANSDSYSALVLLKLHTAHLHLHSGRMVLEYLIGGHTKLLNMDNKTLLLNEWNARPRKQGGSLHKVLGQRLPGWGWEGTEASAPYGGSQRMGINQGDS